MQKNPRLHAISRFLFGRTTLLLSPLFASGLTGHSLLTAAARAFDFNTGRRRQISIPPRLVQILLWMAGCIAFLSALMVLANIAFIHSIR